MNKILIYSIFPAKYRTGVFQILSNYFDTIILFEKGEDTNRHSNFFDKNNTQDFIVLEGDKIIHKYLEVVKHIKKQRPDLVILYDYSTPVSILLAKYCKRRKISYSINVDGAFIKHNFIKDIIKKSIVKRAALFFASGVYAKNYLLEFGANEKKVFFHNFSSLNEDDTLTIPLTQQEKYLYQDSLGLSRGRYAIAVGQFVYRKGFDLLISEWSRLNTDYTLLLIGGGKLNDVFKRYISQNNISNILILDFKPKEVLFNYYKASNFFILPTREDIWGLVINEALANGIPVITTKKCIAGLELIKNDYNGHLIDVDDSSQLGEVLKMYVDRLNTFEIGENCINTIKNYTIENVARSHIEVLHNYFKGTELL